MITDASVQKDRIRHHYDLVTPFYWLLWGRHIHHGLWTENESSARAQQRLTDTLARYVELGEGEEVLDVGCGMGGSAIHLAAALGCRVTGITLSPLQRRWARMSARWHGQARRTEFHCLDAEHAEFEPAQFDVVWSIECTEHLYDKGTFFRRAAGWLRPGGRMAICAWLAGDDLACEERVHQVQQVCEGFLCPSLATRAEYCEWMEQAGLVVGRAEDWTERVARTWEICSGRVRRTGMRRLAAWIDRGTVAFLDRFETILAAYRSGAMQYGCFVAHKPLDSPVFADP